MKRKLSVLLIAVLLLSLFGCAVQVEETQPEDTQPEDTQPEVISIFTDAFFADVVEICDAGNEPVSGTQMEPVIQYLKGLTLTASDIHLATQNEEGDLLVGLGEITFVKSDGTEISFLRNHRMFTYSDKSNTYSYVTEEGVNLNIGLNEAFNQGLNQSGNE